MKDGQEAVYLGILYHEVLAQVTLDLGDAMRPLDSTPSGEDSDTAASSEIPTVMLKSSAETPTDEEHAPPFRVLHRRQDRDTQLALNHPLLRQRYNLVNPDGTPPQLIDGILTALALGGGSYGMVVRASDTRGPDRAIKFLVHHPEASSEGYAAGLAAELSETTREPYTHVIPVIDHDRLRTADGGRLHFLVSHFVDGPTLDVYCRELFRNRALILGHPSARRRLHDQILAVLDDLLAGMEELSRAHVVHMDLKPRNTLVFPRALPGEHVALDGNPFALPFARCLPGLRLYIIDLGGARHLPSLSAAERVPLVMTKYYFPSHWKDDLQLRGTHRSTDWSADARAVQEFGSAIDVHCGGRTLEELFLDRVTRRSRDLNELRSDELSEETDKESFWSTVFGEDFPLVEGLIARMLGGPRPSRTEPSEIRRFLHTIAPHNSRSILAASTLIDPHPTRRIRVGRNLVTVSPPFDQCIDHPQFQRLRRINQLSLLALVFPDATHTRFAHSLRAFHLAKQFISALYRQNSFRLLFDRREVDHLLAAALLHDVGQYPFSHAIEDLRKRGEFETLRARRIQREAPEHYLMQVRFDQEHAWDVLNARHPRVAPLAEILAGFGIETERVHYLFSKGEKRLEEGPPANIGRDLIAGLIDVDRVSYLMHDSERSGVPFGLSIDSRSLAEALTIRCDDVDDPGTWGLGVEEGGIAAVEALLAATYWMYRNVYWHHANRGMMAVIKFVVRRLLEARHNDGSAKAGMDFRDYLEEVAELSEWTALQRLQSRWNELRRGRESELGDPLESLASGERLGYRRVLSMRWTETTHDVFVGMAKRMSPEREDDLLRGIAATLPSGARAREGDILIDYPLKKRFWSMSDKVTHESSPEAQSPSVPPLWVVHREKLSKTVDGWIPIEEASRFLKMLGNMEDTSSRRIRLYFSRPLLQNLERLGFWADRRRLVGLQSIVSETVRSWRQVDIATRGDEPEA